jgi:threonyl-tRNA synthetase
LIEHFAGNFPTWLAPVQVYVLPVRENHEDLAKEITKKLHNQFVRVEYLDSSDNLGKRIRKAKESKTPYTVIIGDKDIEARMITVETRGQESGTRMKAEDFIEKISKEIKDRTLS